MKLFSNFAAIALVFGVIIVSSRHTVAQDSGGVVEGMEVEEAIQCWREFIKQFHGRRVTALERQTFFRNAEGDFEGDRGWDKEMDFSISKDGLTKSYEAKITSFVGREKKVLDQTLIGHYVRENDKLFKVRTSAYVKPINVSTLVDRLTYWAQFSTLDKHLAANSVSPLMDYGIGGTISEYLDSEDSELSISAMRDGQVKLICTYAWPSGDDVLTISISFRPHNGNFRISQISNLVERSPSSDKDNRTYRETTGPFIYEKTGQYQTIPKRWKNEMSRIGHDINHLDVFECEIKSIRSMRDPLDQIYFRTFTIPNGSRVQVEGQEAVRYEYHDGEIYKMVDDGSLQSLDGEKFTPPGFFQRTRWYWLTGSVLVAALVFYFFRKGKK